MAESYKLHILVEVRGFEPRCIFLAKEVSTPSRPDPLFFIKIHVPCQFKPSNHWWLATRQRSRSVIIHRIVISLPEIRTMTGGQGGTRTLKIQILSLTRIPIPSHAHCQLHPSLRRLFCRTRLHLKECTMQLTMESLSRSIDSGSPTFHLSGLFSYQAAVLLFRTDTITRQGNWHPVWVSNPSA